MDCVGVIDFATGKPILFAPKLDRIYEIWMTLHSTDDLMKKYEYEVREISELAAYINERKPDTIYINKGVNSDSKLTTCHPDLSNLELSGEIDINSSRMHDILAESRVIKNEEEIDAMRWAS
jgi:Xaa-Pro aminopeptidase